MNANVALYLIRLSDCSATTFSFCLMLFQAHLVFRYFNALQLQLMSHSEGKGGWCLEKTSKELIYLIRICVRETQDEAKSSIKKKGKRKLKSKLSGG